MKIKVESVEKDEVFGPLKRDENGLAYLECETLEELKKFLVENKQEMAYIAPTLDGLGLVLN